MTERAVDELGAANMALDKIGATPVASLNETTARARVCRRNFGAARDAMLRAYDWNFASTWCVPPALADARAGHFRKRYQLPDDCVCVRDVKDLEEDSWEVVAERTVDAAEAETEVLVLLCDTTAPEVRFTRRVANVRLWDALALDYFANTLGALINPTIGRDPAVTAKLQADADRSITPAKRVDAREKSRSTIRRDTSWIRARRIGGSRGRL